MKKILFLALAFSFSAFASKDGTHVTLDEWYSTYSRASLSEFREKCSAKVNLVKNKMEDLELYYDDLDSGTFKVEMELNPFRYRQGRRSRRGYSCDADITNKATSYKVHRSSSIMLKRLSRSEHKSACDKILESNEDSKEIIFQGVIFGRTLLQGRYCYVYSAELLQKNL